MKRKTKGAWIIHHVQKIQNTTSQEFESIAKAGKCGLLLSAISGARQSQLALSRVKALAKANGIGVKTELPTILDELKRQRLLELSGDTYEVLGLTSAAVLEHTVKIFEEEGPEDYEDAVLNLSDLVSENPLTSTYAVGRISDEFKISTPRTQEIINLAHHIGFYDIEPISDKDNLIFNGNLFRKDDAKKINAVLNSLNTTESNHLKEVNAHLDSTGCMSLDHVLRILGDILFQKVHSIGLFDVNMVGNESGKNYFVTRPSAFSKFSNSIEDDALDLAKALVASLTYGMTISNPGRGRIDMVNLLMNKLIDGKTVGPATAIGSDYQALEFKGVIKVTPANNGMFYMSLLKPDVGRLALSVIQYGDTIAEEIPQLLGARVTQYGGPERTREDCRRKSDSHVRLNVSKLLDEIRTGGLSR